jgi:hypothetical protein
VVPLGLVNRILADLASVLGVLAMLSVAVELLWERLSVKMN